MNMNKQELKKIYVVVSEGCEWGRFDSIEEAYDFAINHIHFLKMACGDIYVPYEIKEYIK